MKKKQPGTPVGNTLVKESPAEERRLPEELEKILEDDELARRLKLTELKDKIASGRYSVSAEEVARAILNHASDSDEES